MIFGSSGAKAAKKAAELQLQATRESIAELRRQFGITEKNIDPFVQAGTNALPGVVDASSAGGFDARLGEIFGTQTFGNLLDERTRAVQGQLSAGGLTRSGDALAEIANVPTDIGLQLESLLFGRESGLVDRGQNAVNTLAGFGQSNATNIANLTQQGGRAAASGVLGAQQARAAGLQGALNLGGSIASAATSGGGIGALVGSFFSDPRLKENIKLEKFVKMKEGHILGLYSWEWVETNSKIINNSAPYGFLTTEVKKYYPDYVFEFCGFEGMDYPKVLDHIERVH